MAKSAKIQKVLAMPQLIWGWRSYWIRGVFCWFVGVIILLNQSKDNFDLRFQIRGASLQQNNIVIVNISEREWALIRGNQDSNTIQNGVDHLSSLSDTYFWHESTWVHVLKKSLSLNPEVIGVSFVFGHNIAPLSSSNRDLEILRNSKIVWGAELDNEGKIIYPRFARRFDDNSGILELNPDTDGILRRFTNGLGPTNHFAAQLAKKFDSQSQIEADLGFIINYQGPSRTFETISLYELLTEPDNSRRFVGKIMIFGAENSPGHTYQTPTGPMSESESLANIVDNIIYSRNIQRIPYSVYVFLLAGLIILSAWNVFRFNQLTSFIFHFITTVILLAFSAWAFDAAYIFIPSLPIAITGFCSYIIFLSYQSNIYEHRAWQLEQEKQYLHDIEKLKQNFVSLISHDLKTPIAKIQGTVDKLMSARPNDKNLESDLKSLRQSGTELNRYIRSILQVSRVEAADFRINRKPTDINDLTESVLTELHPLAKQKHIQLSKALEPMFSIEIDEILIREVIHNLIENAIKYTPQRGHIEVRTTESDQQISLLVKDNGPGIPENELNDVWTKFYRGQSEKDGQSNGSGLGLYLVKYFVELHGGTVFINSQIGNGTEIGFYLPIPNSETDEMKEQV